MSEILFLVEQVPEGGYIARALGESVFTEADTLPELRLMIQEAVHCHFETESRRVAVMMRGG